MDEELDLQAMAFEGKAHFLKENKFSSLSPATNKVFIIFYYQILLVLLPGASKVLLFLGLSQKPIINGLSKKNWS